MFIHVISATMRWPPRLSSRILLKQAPLDLRPPRGRASERANTELSVARCGDCERVISSPIVGEPQTSSRGAPVNDNSGRDFRAIVEGHVTPPPSARLVNWRFVCPDEAVLHCAFEPTEAFLTVCHTISFDVNKLANKLIFDHRSVAGRPRHIWSDRRGVASTKTRPATSSRCCAAKMRIYAPPMEWPTRI